jgi:hypothetical protein
MENGVQPKFQNSYAAPKGSSSTKTDFPPLPSGFFGCGLKERRLVGTLLRSKSFMKHTSLLLRKMNISLKRGGLPGLVKKRILKQNLIIML